MNEPTDHKEAEELAFLRREESNLARCYLDLKLQVVEMKKLLGDIHEAGRGLFLQLDPRGGVGERLGVVWDRLTPYAEKRKCCCHPMSYQEGLDGNCIKCRLPMENRKDENLPPGYYRTHDGLIAGPDSAH